jgi:hypothetical protein
MKTKRTTAIIRLRRDCKAAGETLHISRSIKAQVEFGECYVTDADGKVVQQGSMFDVMNDRNLLRKDETIG